MSTRRSILSSMVVIGMVAAMLTTLSMATFTDQVVSENNTLTAGTLFMSVDGDCGPPGRTSGGGGDGGGDPCETTTEELSLTNLQPGDAESHEFTIINEGTLAGTLSVGATVTGDCFAVDVSGPVSATLSPNGEAGDTTTATVEVSMPELAANECQGESGSVTVTFDLVQLS